MTFDELYIKLLKEHAIEEGLFKATGGVADKAIGAVARDIAPKATGAVDATASAVADGFGRGDRKGKKGKRKDNLVVQVVVIQSILMIKKVKIYYQKH